MGELTGISWCDSTWNPWYGCRKVSPGCDNCYAERDMTRYGRDWRVTRAATSTFSAPLRWKTPRRIFTCSWSDFFIEEARPWLSEAWEIMRRTPQHTYQVLTKRPGLMAAWADEHGWLPNVWAGTSVESAKYLPRLDVLARVPAQVRFVSAEPLLEPLDLRPWLQGGCDWVITGGESGPGARPMRLEWARSLRDQCQQAGVPFFLKQLGGLHAGGPALLDGREWREFPAEQRP